ncbi:MAG: agmatinase [Desulfovibrionaceae bacterium]|nr:agmatinase [Desulfovibrionaceae bacterium]
MVSHFLDGEIDNARPEDAAWHIIPVPLESTVSYGTGTAGGPAAVIDASAQLELWDGASEPGLAGLHTTAPVDCSGPVTKVLDRIEDAVCLAAECEALPLVLGGEHTVTLGALRALKNLHRRFGVVQFDAHADLRNTFEGSPYSHACVMRRAVDDLGLQLFQIGVRALCKEEADFREANDIPHLDARELFLKGMPRHVLPTDFPDTIYITFDVDGLDPSVIRATGTPVPGGLGWQEAIFLLQAVTKGRKLIGADVVELAPAPGDHASDFAAAQLAYLLMGLGIPAE